jgi:cytochrome P450
LTHVNGYLDELIQTKRREPEDQGDLLGMLVRASQQDIENGESQRQVDRQVRDETISMINASLDATAAAMSWTLCLVAKHTAVQTQLYDEIQRRAGESREMEVDRVELPFAERVVHESLRLYPPNWVLIIRRCAQDTTLGGFRIPKGSWLYVFPYVVQRDARWFTDPDSFRPDRFAPDDFGPAQRSAYIPLGVGPHVCIGKALSTIILTTILARILQEFRLELPSDQLELEPDVGIVLRPKEDLQLLVTRHQDGQVPTSTA